MAASKALLKSAEEVIDLGVKTADMEEVQCGHSLLAKANASLDNALHQLHELEKATNKKRK